MLNLIEPENLWFGMVFQNGKAKDSARKLKSIKTANSKNQSINENSANADIICTNLPYFGIQSDQLLLSLKRNTSWCLNKKI